MSDGESESETMINFIKMLSEGIVLVGSSSMSRTLLKLKC